MSPPCPPCALPISLELCGHHPDVTCGGAAEGNRKGKWAPLAYLVPRVGARRMLALQSNLLEMCLAALERQVACSSVSSLWIALVKGLRQELHSDLGARHSADFHRTQKLTFHISSSTGGGGGGVSAHSWHFIWASAGNLLGLCPFSNSVRRVFGLLSWLYSKGCQL